MRLSLRVISLMPLHLTSSPRHLYDSKLALQHTSNIVSGLSFEQTKYRGVYTVEESKRES